MKENPVHVLRRAQVVAVVMGVLLLSTVLSGLSWRRAEAARAGAIRQLQRARMHRLVDRFRNTLNGYMELRVLLAVEAVRSARDYAEPVAPSAEEALRDALEEIHARNLLVNDHWVTSLAAVPFSNFVALSTLGGPALLWNLQMPEAAPTQLSKTESFQALDISPDGDQLAVGGNTARVFRLPYRGEPPRSLDTLGRSLLKLKFDSAGRVLAGICGDGAVLVWRLDKADSKPRVLDHHGEEMDSVAISPNGRILATGGRGGTLFLWHVEDLSKPMFVSNKWTSWISTIIFGGDGRSLFALFQRGEVLHWDLFDLKRPALVYKAHKTGAYTMSVNPETTRLSTTGMDGIIKIWKIGEPAGPIKLLRGHSSQITALTYLHYGSRLASGSFDKTVRLWDPENSNESVVLKGYNHFILPFAIAGSPPRLITSDGEEKHLGADDLSVDQLIERARHAVKRNMTWSEWRRNVPDEDYRATFPELGEPPDMPDSEGEVSTSGYRTPVSGP